MLRPTIDAAMQTRRRGRVRRPRRSRPSPEANASACMLARVLAQQPAHPAARRADQSPRRLGAARGARPARRARGGRHDGRRGAARPDPGGGARGRGGRHGARTGRRERADREDAHARSSCARSTASTRAGSTTRSPASRCWRSRAVTSSPQRVSRSALRIPAEPRHQRRGQEDRAQPIAAVHGAGDRLAHRAQLADRRHAAAGRRERRLLDVRAQPGDRARGRSVSTTASRSAKSRGVSLSGAAQP